MMKNPKFCIGKTLDDLASRTGLIRGGCMVYLLANKADTTGWLIDSAYYIRDIAAKHNDLRQCVVKYAQNDYGTLVLRVQRPARRRR